MTEGQKAIIQRLRSAGESYANISAAIGLPTGTIKAFCSRSIVKVCSENALLCAHCGGEIAHIPGHRLRRFCSFECRNRWWRDNRDKRVRNGAVHVCAYCKKAYPSYDNNSKYCSHPCYIAHRFGKRAGQL